MEDHSKELSKGVRNCGQKMMRVSIYLNEPT
jgi:hypothetical protein